MGFLDKVKSKVMPSPEDMLNEANKAINKDPTDPDAWNKKGRALNKQGKYDEAIAAYDDAIKYYEEAAPLNKYNTHLWLMKGVSIQEQGDIIKMQGDLLTAQSKYEEAIKCYDEVIRLNPKDDTPWSFKSKAYKSLGWKSAADDANAMADKLARLRLGISPKD